LQGAFPNPFNLVTRIRFDVPRGGGRVALKIYDVMGRLVRTLVDERMQPRRKTVAWKGLDDHGNPVATGVYFLRMRAPGYADTRKLVLLR
jgi:flagellar hook assembly protein FlgD